MAKIKLTPGQLYFLRERDFLTNEVSRYVKIGLVRDKKETEERIREHQTGNPREIYDYCSLESPFVEHLETLMHYWYGPKWITGEWFDMTEEETDAAIEVASELIGEQKEIEENLKLSYQLGTIESSGEMKSADEQSKEVWGKLVDAKVELDLLNARKKIIDQRLRRVLGTAGSIDGVLNVTFKEGGIRFNEKKLAEEHSELYEEYCTQESSSLSGTFTVKGKKQLKKEYPEIFDQLKSLEKIELFVSDIDFEEPIDRTTEIEALHAAFIDNQRDIYIKEWWYARLEAKLKLLTGEADGIENICGWNREMKQKISFDKKKFEEDHPELFKKYLTKSPDNYSVNIFSWRNYPVVS